MAPAAEPVCHNAVALLDGLRNALGAAALFAALALWFTRRLPARTAVTGATVEEGSASGA